MTYPQPAPDALRHRTATAAFEVPPRLSDHLRCLPVRAARTADIASDARRPTVDIR